MNPPPPVKASSPAEIRALADRLQAAGRAAGFRVEPFGEIEGCPLFALTKRTPGPRPRIYLSAGLHGDEPAPPRTLLTLLEAGVFDARANWFLCPLLNPSGLIRGTRENAAGLDLNRDYKDVRAAETAAHIGWLHRQPAFDLTLCLHEDWESMGYYLYELNPLQRPTLSHAMIAAVAAVCPIEVATLIDGREIAEPGIIRPIADPLLRENWPESIYLRAQHTTLSYTTETPSALPLAQRIAAHSAAIQAAITQTVHDWRRTPLNPPAAES
ncbi:MAG: M14 family metallocarboxypeptidase [Verrucomicrobia bacterium]|nr:M14 family metallocarboxypeptidase [Verrucomicrobiota bacterium]